MGRASQMHTNPPGTRFRHFGARHRTSYRSIRSPVGPRRHGPHGEVGGVLIPILGWSRQPLYGSGRGRMPFQPAFWRGGTQPTPSGLYRGRGRRGWLASLGGPLEWLGHLQFMPTPSEGDFGIFGWFWQSPEAPRRVERASRATTMSTVQGVSVDSLRE